MRALYQEHTARFPRLSSDRLFIDPETRLVPEGMLAAMNRFVQDEQLLKPELWHRFVDQFRQQDADFDAGWRGEYWGKMMRGACFTWSCTRDPALYAVLTDTILDMLSVLEEQGRISTYALDHELQGWDIWCRKYVLLGMQYYWEICADEALKQRLIRAMEQQVDDLRAKLGLGLGQKPINTATRNWRGLNSSSVLEPVVRLYAMNGRQEYLDFAAYIIGEGGTSVEDIFHLALQDGLLPYQYPVTKAYEMISCFEGLLEYYRITGTAWCKEAVVRFADRILESDFTVIGSAGCTHELFDHSTVRQANRPSEPVMQETCVTVTLMKFMTQLTLLTGDAKYTDAFERSAYNGYAGAFNTEHRLCARTERECPDAVHEPLPFDSYSPLTAGVRGVHVGGLKVMADRHYYGCCACIASAGSGLMAKMAVLTDPSGLVLNLYFPGTVHCTTPAGQQAVLRVETDYPRGGSVRVHVSLPEPEQMTIAVRVPAWSRRTGLTVNGEPVKTEAGYVPVSRTWKTGDELMLALDMRTECIRPIPYGRDVLMNKVVWSQDVIVPQYDEEDPQAKHHFALRRGPLFLAQENRLGYSVDDPVLLQVGEDGFVDAVLPEEDTAPYPHLTEVAVPLADGRCMTVTDYASAGKTWSQESKMAVWMAGDTVQVCSRSEK